MNFTKYVYLFGCFFLFITNVKYLKRKRMNQVQQTLRQPARPAGQNTNKLPQGEEGGEPR